VTEPLSPLILDGWNTVCDPTFLGSDLPNTSYHLNENFRTDVFAWTAHCSCSRHVEASLQCCQYMSALEVPRPHLPTGRKKLCSCPSLSCSCSVTSQPSFPFPPPNPPNPRMTSCHPYLESVGKCGGGRIAHECIPIPCLTEISNLDFTMLQHKRNRIGGRGCYLMMFYSLFWSQG